MYFDFEKIILDWVETHLCHIHRAGWVVSLETFITLR